MSSEKARHVGTIAHIDHGKNSLTAAITRVLQQKEAAPAVSSDVKIPEWAMDEAERIGVSTYGRHAKGFVLWPLITEDGTLAKIIIARALLAAEQRGRKAGLEEAAKECDRFAQSGIKLWAEDDTDRAELHLAQSYGAQSCAAAIRSLGEQE